MKDLIARMSACDAANDAAAERLQASRPVWADVAPARDAVPGLRDGLLLHSGPPVAWERMAGPMKGALIGAMLFEGWAADPAEAERRLSGGEVAFEPCHHHDAVGPMAGVLSPSMPVCVMENRAPEEMGGGGRSFVSLNEGLGKVLRYGAYAEEVLDRLRWMAEELGPVLGAAVRAMGGLDVKTVMARALQMGDELHNRNAAATSTLARALLPALAEAADAGAFGRAAAFLAENDHFFLNIGMAAAKVGLETMAGVENCSLVYTMARNGVEFGVRVAGLEGRWFTAPAGVPVGLYFPGFSERDANPDIGDSAIMETYGLGGFVMGASPAIVRFVGGSTREAMEATREMFRITWTESRDFTMPSFDFRGAPTAIDVRKVVGEGVLPNINTGIAHREPGIGQIGAGILRAPEEPFRAALVALAERMGV